MKSSFHSLVSFLPLFCNCQFRILDWIQFLCSQAHIPAGWRLGTRLTLLNWNLLYNYFAWTEQKTRNVCCWVGVFTGLLHNNGSYSIVACVFVATEICLPSSCLAMVVFSDVIIPAFGCHVTVSTRRRWVRFACCIRLLGYLFNLFFDPEMEAVLSSETSVKVCRTTHSYIPEDSTLRSHR
jgi:hypothetical protein